LKNEIRRSGDAPRSKNNVQGELADCGHFIPEEPPDGLTKLLLDFLGR
jgi:hypothetical protein